MSRVQDWGWEGLKALVTGGACVAVCVICSGDVDAKAAIHHVDPGTDTGWFEMLEADNDVALKWNPMTGDSWALACPGTKTSCEWDPIGFRGETPSRDFGQYDAVLTAQGVVFWHVRTGDSWILACPGTIRTCDWEPLEVR